MFAKFLSNSLQHMQNRSYLRTQLLFRYNSLFTVDSRVQEEMGNVTCIAIVQYSDTIRLVPSCKQQNVFAFSGKNK